MKAILLNGPPRSGKDSAATTIYNSIPDTLDPLHEKMSRPNKEAFAGIMKVEMKEEFIVPYYEEHKEEIIPELGISFRQWQIDFSEKFMKPLYGEAIFGQLLLGRLDRYKTTWNSYGANTVAIISDCGFQIEVTTLLKSKLFSDVLLIRCHREGFTYEGDSRQYVYLKGQPGTEIDLLNVGTINQWNGCTAHCALKWLEGKL